MELAFSEKKKGCGVDLARRIDHTGRMVLAASPCLETSGREEEIGNNNGIKMSNKFSFYRKMNKSGTKITLFFRNYLAYPKYADRITNNFKSIPFNVVNTVFQKCHDERMESFWSRSFNRNVRTNYMGDFTSHCKHLFCKNPKIIRNL